MAGTINPKATLNNSTQKVSTTYGFEMGDDYAFYDRNIDDSIEPRYYQHIISQAKKLVIWDPYFMEQYDGQLFESVTKEGVEIQILTVCREGTKDQPPQGQDEVKQLRDNIKNALRKAKITTFSGSVTAFKYEKRKIYTGMGKRIYPCHDRFLIVDDTTAYLVGASMNNQLSSEWTFGIMKIDKAKSHDAYKLITDKFLATMKLFAPNINGWRARL